MLVKYSVQRGVTGHQDGHIVKRQMECHFPRRIPSTEKKCKQESMLSVARRLKERLHTTCNTVIVLCASMGVSRLNIQ
jgi:hypothetical protein